MGMLHSFRKGLQKNNLMFDANMYDNVLGSLIITHYILNKLNGVELDVNDIKTRWKKLVKKGNLDFWLDDPDFISKALALFDMKPMYGRFAMVQGRFNLLFLPYIDGQVMPVKETGVYPLSARDGKIYPITEQKEETNEIIE